MRIELKQPYKSIASLTSEEIPDFAILIGRNGAGKTQLLEALKEGRARIPDVDVDDMELYDMVSFCPPKTSRANRNSNQFAQLTADTYLLSQSGGRPTIESAVAIFDQFASNDDDLVHSLTEDVRHMPEFTVFAAKNRESPYKKTLYEKVFAPLNRTNAEGQGVRGPKQLKNSFNGNQAVLLSTAMKLAGKLPHELTRGDILRASHAEGETLANSISAVFAGYKIDQFIWAHKRIETEHVSFPDLTAEYRTTYAPPWETLRAILSAMRDAAGDDGLFNFDFSDPGDYELDMGNYERFGFSAVMTNRTTGAQYDLDSLSSGEQILMALCLVSFNQYLGRRRPKLLLLDELDAVLHPSMVTALASTLKTLFVSRGTKVLMTSHSAMTVAALDGAEIFRIIRTGRSVEVCRTTKSEAINELSQGIATVDVGLRIAAHDEAKVTILTEGHNARHLKRWVELNFSKDVHVFEDLEQHRNDLQLLAYGRLLGRMNTNTHFVVVWDCDADAKAKTLRSELPRDAKVTPYAFAKRQDNTIAKRGIENNYDEDILEAYSTTTRGGDGTVLGRGFQNSRKTDFANHVMREGTPEYFSNFQDLHAIVSDILGLPSKASCPKEGRET